MTTTPADSPTSVRPTDRPGDQVPAFAVVPGTEVSRILSGQEKRVVDVVTSAYMLHGAGSTVNPPSHFLRFPDRPQARIIALPASVRGEFGVDGLKWISSVPANVAAGLPRASAVLVLNDQTTGFPLACLEASIISAARTAASAVLAADLLTRGRPRPRRIGFVGAGFIARYVHTYLVATGWQFDEIGVCDTSADHAAGFRDYLGRADTDTRTRRHARVEDLLAACDMVVFATVAGTPYVTDPGPFAHHPLVLNLSLRDLAPQIVLESTNVVDDIDHCLQADTSVHLAQQATGSVEFIHGTIYDFLTRKIDLPRDRTTVFSPFGLGTLDLAVGKYVYDRAREKGSLTQIDGFFHEVRRYG